jgi:hypothetical protein
MVTVSAFRDGVEALRANPSLLAGGLLVGVARHPQYLDRVIDSPGLSAGVGVACLLALPFVAGGFIGLARSAIADTEVSAADFLDAAHANYTRLLVGIVLFVGIVAGIAVGLGLVTMAVGVGGMQLLKANQVAGVATAVGLLGLWVVALFGAVLCLQFFTAAIVLEDSGVLESFRRSVSLVRSNPTSVVGFTVLWSGASNLVVPDDVVGTSSIHDIVGVPPIDAAVPGTVTVPVAIALTTVATTYLYTVYVAYYIRLAADAPAPTTATATASAAD